MTSHDPVADSLLVHTTFVQRLAHALAGADGDDLAQETWIAALQAGPHQVRSVRGWLATIAKNLARNLARGDARRLRREALDAGDGIGVPDVAEIVAREEARRHVVEAVVTLPEPLRTVVLLHFFEGLDSRTIGERLGTPASTVRTQLQRALTALRQRLDREHGERRAAWALPLLAASKTAPTLTLGLLLRTSWPLRASLGIAALVFVAWLVVPLLNPPPVAPPVPPVEVASSERRDREPETPVPAAPQQRDAVATVAPTAPAHGPEDLWGRVVDAATEAPVAGAEVVLEHRDADEMTNLDLEYGKRAETIGTAQSGPDGGFAFRVQRALQHRITVRAGGYAPLHEARCTGGSEFVLRLERPAAVEGVVRAADGTPLADIQVDAFVRGGTGEHTTTHTSTDGAFRLDGLPPRVSYVVALPEGKAASRWQQVALEPGATAHVDITLTAGRTVRGTVRDAETGIPIAGARIAMTWTMRAYVATAADGTYAIGGLGEREQLYARIEGFADQTQPVPSQDDPIVDFALVRGDTILGRIVDETGRGIPGAFAAAGADESPRGGSVDTYWRSATVDARGGFRIDGLGRDDQAQPRAWQLLVRAPGMGTRVLALPHRRLVDGALDVGDIRLVPQATLTGRVVDDAGQPIAAAVVTLRGTPDDALALAPEAQGFRPIFHFWQRETRASADGVFRIAGLAAGNYELVAEPSGAMRHDESWRVESGPLQVSAGTHVTAPDLVVVPGLAITGHAHFPANQAPAAGTTITITAFGPMSDTRSGRVAADGSFRIDRLEPGDYRLATMAAPPGLALAPRAGIAAGTENVELQFVAATTIEGRVLDDDGKPVLRAYVTFFPEGVHLGRNTRTDADGRFRVEVAPGVVGSLSAMHPDVEMWQTQKADVVAGTVDLVMQLPRRSGR